MVNPSDVHTGERSSPGEWKYRAFYLSSAFILETALELTGKDVRVVDFPVPVLDDDRCARALLSAHRHFEANDDLVAGESSLTSALESLLEQHASLSSSSPELPTTRNAVKRALDFLHDCYARRISLRELAARSGLSRFHFLRQFEAATGMPPYAYLLQVRVEQAKRLLERGYPPAEVAAEVGFADQSHLHKHFKRFVGVTPGVFAREMTPRQTFN